MAWTWGEMTVMALAESLSNLHIGQRRPQEDNRNEGRKSDTALCT